MNLNEYYTHDQMLHLFNFKYRMQLKRHIEKHNLHPVWVCQQPYYHKAAVGTVYVKLLQDDLVAKGKHPRKAANEADYLWQLRQLQDPGLTTMDLDLDIYKPRCMLIEALGTDKTDYAMYEYNRQVAAPQVRTVLYNKTIFWHYGDILKCLGENNVSK